MKKLLLFLLLFCFQQSIIAQSAPPFWNDIVHFKKLDSAQKPPRTPILLIGSSSFTRWTDVQKYFPEHTILNRGFGGSTLPDVIRYFYEVVVKYHPKQVLIYCGENDLASSDAVTPNEVLTRFKTLYGMIRAYYPETVISFVSIKPSPSRARIQANVKRANRDIKAFLANEKNTSYIDIYDAMLDAKGNMRNELYVEDMLHMKPEGYQIWQKIMLPHLLK